MSGQVLGVAGWLLLWASSVGAEPQFAGASAEEEGITEGEVAFDVPVPLVVPQTLPLEGESADRFALLQFALAGERLYLAGHGGGRGVVLHALDVASGDSRVSRPLPDRALRWLLARILPYPGRFRLAIMGAWFAKPVAWALPKKLRAMVAFAPPTLPPPSLMDKPQTFPAQLAAQPPTRRTAMRDSCPCATTTAGVVSCYS